jgi:two-component system chemotaxis response regulator CheY
LTVSLAFSFEASFVMTQIRTLLVGEQSSLRRMLSDALDRLGVGPVEHASNGAAALVMMREKNHRLVISEWLMEPVSGLQLLKFVRAEPALSDVRFLITVPARDEAAEVAAREAGADALLLEPYSLASLTDTIGSVL